MSNYEDDRSWCFGYAVGECYSQRYCIQDKKSLNL